LQPTSHNPLAGPSPAFLEDNGMLTIQELSTVPLFSTLPERALVQIAKGAADIRLAGGEYAAHEGDDRALFVVLEGKIEVTKLFDGIERTIGWRQPGQIFGEVPIALGGLFLGSYRAAEPSRVARMDVRLYHAIAAMAPQIAGAVGALAGERIGGLQGLAANAPAVQVTIVGQRWDTDSYEMRRFLARNQVSFEWIDADDPELSSRLPVHRPPGDELPTLVLADGATLVRPQPRDVAERLGLQTRGRHTEYDTVVIGGGPAGLAAAVYGASEGLRTLVVEREAPGGQAGTSSRIENYLCFPNGISGDELASRALQQARRLGAEILVTRHAVRIDPASHQVHLDGDTAVSARSIIIATGVTWRRLEIDGAERLIGKGVSYGAARSEALNTQDLDIHLIGAGNSAGQAALFFANHARSVTLLVRGDSLEKSMSHYLIEKVLAKSNIIVELNTEVRGAHGDTHLTGIDVLDRGSGEVRRRECAGLFAFIGADAQTAWLPSEIARDANGYVLTGTDAAQSGRWTPRRDPYLLETTVPGVFACGDVRFSPVKRVASAVGEGSMAIAFTHQYLRLEAAARP
jgi:thioredoxin reductase (NADPH)